MATLTPDMITPDVEARFWAKVDRRGPDDCWPWLGDIVRRPEYGDSYNRGVCRIGPQTATAARVASVLSTGQAIPEGMFACHKCDNPMCVNPSHIWVGTPKDNSQDARAKGRSRGMSDTHCKHGHEFSTENTFFHKRGYRQCRTCSKIRNAARFHKPLDT